MQPKNQEDIVRQDQGYQEKEETRKVGLPGIDQLHTRSTEDIANALAIVLKSQPGITKLVYKVGESIELTTQK